MKNYPAGSLVDREGLVEHVVGLAQAVEDALALGRESADCAFGVPDGDEATPEVVVFGVVLSGPGDLLL
jgi:hypothetical protein